MNDWDVSPRLLRSLLVDGKQHIEIRTCLMPLNQADDLLRRDEAKLGRLRYRLAIPMELAIKREIVIKDSILIVHWWVNFSA